MNGDAETRFLVSTFVEHSGFPALAAGRGSWSLNCFEQGGFGPAGAGESAPFRPLRRRAFCETMVPVREGA